MIFPKVYENRFGPALPKNEPYQCNQLTTPPNGFSIGRESNCISTDGHRGIGIECRFNCNEDFALIRDTNLF